MSDCKKSFIIPSELRLSQKWDFAAENFITRPALGLGVAGLASIVLFRGRCARFCFASFGTGVGVGDAFRVSSFEFEKEKSKLEPTQT